MDDLQALAFLGIFLGALARMVFPYLRKLNEAAEKGQVLPFNWSYVTGPITAIVLAGITAMLVMPGVEVTPEITVFSTFTVGWGSTDILNQLVK